MGAAVAIQVASGTITSSPGPIAAESNARWIAEVQEGRAIAWIHPPHLPYAPALASAGLPLDACLVVRPASAEDALWSADQTLRSGACGAALFWLPEKTDYASLRRLQMAAESGCCLAVLYRPTTAASLASPAHLRILLAHCEGRLLVSLPKRRGPPLLRPIEIRIPGRPKKGSDPFSRLGSRLRGNDETRKRDLTPFSA